MEISKLKKKQIVREIDNVIQNDFNIDISNDEDFLRSSQYNWDDLNKLKTDLGIQIVEFINQVNTVITNPDVVNNLNSNAKQFEKTIGLFFSDINNFSLKVRDIRVQHEHKTGHIDNINDFNQYNRIAIQYQSLFSELAILVSPALADLMMIIADIIPMQVDRAVIENQNKEGATHD